MPPKQKVPPKAKGSEDDDSDLEDLRQSAPASSKEEVPRQPVKGRPEIPKPRPAYQLHEPWAVPLRAGAQAETYRLEGPAAARAGGHRPALQRFSAEVHRESNSMAMPNAPRLGASTCRRFVLQRCRATVLMKMTPSLKRSRRIRRSPCRAMFRVAGTQLEPKGDMHMAEMHR